jgi:hypothetical protein
MKKAHIRTPTRPGPLITSLLSPRQGEATISTPRPYGSAAVLARCFFFLRVSVGSEEAAFFSLSKLEEVSAVPPAVARSCVGCFPSFLRINSVANCDT